MVEIEYTDHLRIRLRIRNIPEEYPKEVYQNPEQKFYDNAEGTSIAVKKLTYNKKLRNMMVVYHDKEGKVEIITIHPISDEKIINRIMSGRWTKK
jgi:hypothetical protein